MNKVCNKRGVLMKKCDSCGKLYQENKDVFCPHCGAVAQKQCTHGSSFDSGRYDRGEIYKSNNPQYQNTTYNYQGEPHAQRESYPYNQPENTFPHKKNYGDKIPEINIPDIKKAFKDGKIQKSKSVGIIGICVVIAFNLITGLLSRIDDAEVFSDYEVVSEPADDYGPFFASIDEATIEVVETEGSTIIFALEIESLGFDDFLPEGMKEDIISGAMAKELISENTLVELMICGFPKKIVSEEDYDNALAECYNYSGKQVTGESRYEFAYDFDYGEIVHFFNGVSFYLENGKHINAELPFTAFSVSEDGEITYYSSYADNDTAWNTVFSECYNYQEINSDLYIDFDSVVTVEEE